MNELGSRRLPQADAPDAGRAIARVVETGTLTSNQLRERAIIERGQVARPEVDAFREIRTRLLAAAEGAGSGGAGLFLVPWFDDAAAEKSIKDETKATIRCFPLGEQHRAEGRVCFYSGKPATHMALFGRAF